MIEHKVLNQSSREQVAELFTNTFTASEGEQEGLLVGKLADDMCSAIDNREIICLGSFQQNLLVGSILFSRLDFAESTRVYLLAPVAVATEYQGQGIGQSLILFGLDLLRQRKVGVAVTYGDPNYYSKLGFQPLSLQVIQAPYELSMPFGWQGISLTTQPIPVLKDRPQCVKAFDNPALW